MNKSIRSFKQGAQAGFTLIELVVVIVILGILAATAIPRFADMATEARLAKANAARGTLQAAAAIAHAQWLVVTPAADGTKTVTLEGNTITMTTAGYPDAAGILLAATFNDYSVTGTAPVSIAVDTAHASCAVTYAPGTTAAPVIASTASETTCK